MIQTQDLILDKGRLPDYQAMFSNVWRHWETARYMYWTPTEKAEDALSRMERTIEFQKTHDSYLVYETSSGQAIGFAGIENLGDGIFGEAGICLGPDFVHRGYGRQILTALLELAKAQGGREFRYFTWAENAPSIALAEAMGFQKISQEERTDPRNGESFTMLIYRRDIL